MRKRKNLFPEEENLHIQSSSIPLDNAELMPIDLFIEIFSRLSAKTIAKCRCVSKLWSSILGLPDFTNLFLEISSACPRLLFTFKLNGKWLFFSTPQPLNPDENLSLLATDHRMCLPTRTGSCLVNAPVRGLLCTNTIWLKYVNDHDLKAMVYNPSTGQTITLPRVRTRMAEARPHLCYDPINKQVKVLCITTTVKPWKVEAYQVLTLGMKELSWRIIECSLPHFPLYNNTGICIKGVLYYIGDPNNNFPKPKFQKPYTVVCFDVMSEKFTYIHHALDNNITWCSTLINYTGKLGVLRVDKYEFFSGRSTSLELWVLDDVEKHKWLKKIYVLPPQWKNLVADTWLRIVGMTSNGEFVFSPDVLSEPFYIFYYNVEKNTIVKIRIQGIGPVSGQKIYSFIDHVEDVQKYLSA